MKIIRLKSSYEELCSKYKILNSQRFPTWMKCYFYSDGNIVEWFICNISNGWVFVIYDTSVKLLYSRIETNPSKMLKDFIDKLKNSITARINSIDIIVASLAKD